MLNVIMLNVVMLRVIRLNVMAFFQPKIDTIMFSLIALGNEVDAGNPN
jgi:hypothetical protein